MRELSTSKQYPAEKSNLSKHTAAAALLNTEDERQYLADNGVRKQDFCCDKCGKIIPERVWDYSMERFFRPLCYNCQRIVRNESKGEY